MKPDWKDAPEWARFLAQDGSGEWAWFENVPEIEPTTKQWIQGGILGNWCFAKPSAVNWMSTLEARP